LALAPGLDPGASRASSWTIEAAINAFWFSESYRVNAATLAIENDARTVPEGYRVRLKNGRYRFEAISF